MGPRRTAVAGRIRDRIFSGLHLGILTPGAKLPSVRAFADEFDADPRVVLAACRDLEAEGVLTVRERSGLYVARVGSEAEPAAARRRTDWIVEVLAEGLRQGVPVPALPSLLAQHIRSVPLRAVCTECNIDQIEELCAELRTAYGLDTVPLDCHDVLSAIRWPPELGAVDLIVTTQFHAHEIAPAAERLGTPMVAVGFRPALFVEIERLLTTSPVYIVVVDVRLATKLRRILTSTPDVKDLHTLVLGTDDFEARLATIPPGVPTYVTQAARRRLGDEWQVSDAPELRSLARDSDRPILSFIVRANARSVDAASIGSRR